MSTTIAVKGHVTTPKKVREAPRLSPGDDVDCEVGRAGRVVVQKASTRAKVPAPPASTS